MNAEKTKVEETDFLVDTKSVLYGVTTQTERLAMKPAAKVELLLN